MKTTVITSTPGPKLPEVGQAWKHRDIESVYVRISDMQGYKVFPCFADGFFFSVCLATGCLCNTGCDADDIVILQPVGGAAVFEYAT